MFLEGEVNWTLVLWAVTAVSVCVALFSAWFAVTHRVRHVTTSSELDLVQKAAESADKRLFETLNAVPVALVETDSQGKFVYANRAAHQLLGRRDAELLGLRFHSATWGITFPDGRPVPPDLLPSARALRGQTVKGFQHLLANPATRRTMLVSVTAMPIENEYGQVVGSMAAIVETEGLTTPQIETAPAVTPDPGYVRRVFEAASSALVVVDAEGQVREVNPVAESLAHGADAPVGRSFMDVFLAEADRAAAHQAIRAGLVASPEDTPVIDAGEVRWRMLPLTDDDGRVDALLLAGERREPEAETSVEQVPQIDPAELDAATARQGELEAELAAARAELDSERDALRRIEAEARFELEGSQRLADVGRLTGGLVHDLNALIGVMTSALDMMLKQADDPSRIRRLGEAALAAGQRGEHLTRRLGAFSEGEDESPVQVMDVAVLLKGLETKLRTQVGPGVDLMVEVPSEPAPVRLDPVIFDGAVRALVANALEAVAGQGSVAVRLEPKMEGGWLLSVRDSGPGFSDEARTRAVEPFFSTKPGAQGLGLAQAHAFARQVRGRMSIDRAPGGGAEVSLSLPEAPADQLVSPDQSQAS
ncbi:MULTISPECIES: PAS domain-containing sensor histidine kinase [unclassified Brevundimonas]|jgi:PAS domain S-box-containing protein|uniref:PAS domain-containing sensor histidine kinase n=1 Tax=unclassified Brevundimonas TaxID=2622653 RepID=UPI000C4C1B5F|nr:MULTISPECIES: PAS domain-containing protein [unclassified Brevundimonas]MAL89620.1 histidine kinase [Brevundimonas sp.]|tara:strand:- start:49778 stop:51556 length:1779 start_codon:yes stop_codon:yes gene_type:complete